MDLMKREKKGPSGCVGFEKRRENGKLLWAPVVRSSFQWRIRGIPGSILRGTTFGQCACLYAWAGLVVHHWWVENRCERRKKSANKWDTPMLAFCWKVLSNSFYNFFYFLRGKLLELKYKWFVLYQGWMS